MLSEVKKRPYAVYFKIKGQLFACPSVCTNSSWFY